MQTTMCECYPVAVQDMLDKLQDVHCYRTMQARQLAHALLNPAVLPEVDRRVLALCALVLGGEGAMALTLGIHELDHGAEDLMLMLITALAALEARDAASMMPYLSRIDTFGGAGAITFLTVKAATLVEASRYSEAADYLAFSSSLPDEPTMLAPLLRMQRMRLWASCRRHCELPVLNADTGAIEMPEVLRSRALDGIRDEIRRLRLGAANTGVLELALARTVSWWQAHYHSVDLVGDPPVEDAINLLIRTLLRSEPLPDDAW